MKRRKTSRAPMSTIIVPVNQRAKRNKAGAGVRFLFWAILVAALVSRVIWLDRASYTIDEINVIRDAVHAKSYSDIWNTELSRFTSYHRLPMLGMIIRASVHAFGETAKYFPSEVSTRLPFALLGVVSIFLAYLLGRDLRDRRLGLWLMFLMAFNTFHVFYSREAYDYLLVIFFTLGVLWSSVRMLHRWEWEQTVDVGDAAGYVVFSTGLLQSHLSGLLFLGPWTAVLAAHLLWDPAKRKLLHGKALILWIISLGLGFLLFLPFLVRVFGFQTTESVNANRFSASAVIAVLGRMGWGEAWWALLPFTAALAAGVVAARKSPDRRLFLLLGIQAAAYFAVQSFMLRVSRFEVRYYSALFPILILFSGLGLDFAGQWISERRKQIAMPLPHLLLALPLLAWMLPSIWMVCKLECRSQSYKPVANWVMANLPNNGIYCYWNGYDARGVPAAYQTPGRFVAYPTVWSSAEDYIRLQVRQRLTSFFLRFPLACYVEMSPNDILAPQEINNEPVEREKLFANQTWLMDPAYQKLVSWKTLPLGEAQWYTKMFDHVLVCYNKIEDLPRMAHVRGQVLYHYFGNEWTYGKDPQDNDWLIVSNSGTFYLGNITDQPLNAVVRLSVMSQPSGCDISIYASNGTKILERTAVLPNFTEVVVSNVVVTPGTTQYALEVLPTPASLQPQLLLYALKVEPAAGPGPSAP
ncbi:MAG: glycosyltransferase family 39 protein [bacterium]